MTTTENPTTTTETIQCTGAGLADKVKELVHQGNVRRITVRHDGNIVLSIPVTLGVVGTLLVPWAAAVGAVAAILTNCSLEVERQSDSPSDSKG